MQGFDILMWTVSNLGGGSKSVVPAIARGKAKDETTLDVLLVEDNPTDALLVKSSIEDSQGFRLETVSRLSSAIAYLAEKSCDIILLDLNLPDATGLEGLLKLRSHVESIAVIVFTGVNDEMLGIMAVQRGAQDYLVKGVDAGRLIQSMRFAAERMKPHNLQDESDNTYHEHFTEREMEVLKLLGKGFTNQEIFQTLGISLTTVKTHIGNILRKLSVTDRTKAVVEAHRRGLI